MVFFSEDAYFNCLFVLFGGRLLHLYVCSTSRTFTTLVCLLVFLIYFVLFWTGSNCNCSKKDNG